VSRRTAAIVAWTLAGLAPVLLVSSVVVSLVGGAGAGVGSGFISAITLTFAVAGVLIATRQPSNAIGWIFLAAGVAAGVGALAGSYAEYWLESGEGSEALGEAAAVYTNLSWIPFVLLPSTFLLLLFPDGHLLSARWRWVAWAAGAGMAGQVVVEGLRAGPIEDFPELENPYGVESAALDVLEGVVVITVLVAILASAVSLVLRFRRARGGQREQLKWLAFAGAVAGVTIPVSVALYEVVGENLANSAIMLSVLGLPAATGIAILRYRLYEIDRVISRTLVYATLTVILGVAYAGLVLLGQAAFSSFAGGSDLAIAASTLVVAALFLPVRSRVQRLVDRRFYRRRYDAQRTLAEFGSRMRQEVELDGLRVDLQNVVHETMQPTHVSLWLRGRS
jgi:hypothetical protein